MKKILLVLSALAIGFSAAAKLPAPSEEAKAKAAEAAAKTAHGNKVADFQLCKSREKVAAHYYKTSGKAKLHPQPRQLVWTRALTSQRKPRLLLLQPHLLLPLAVPSPPQHLPKKADPFFCVTAKSPVGNGGGFLR
jgi:hypothetical protein